ncbi:MAG: hypothetical protein K6E93_03095 [Bacteroidales bacterium]|nr:hypothetical protein [Bacteroidales bacterium]
MARAYSNYLYKSDLEGLVVEGMTPEDSVAIVNNYINQWVQQMVVLEKAKRNINNTFEKELQNYKNSLITYEYECHIVDQLLDTSVSGQEIEDYYNANKDNFTLRTSIIRCYYIKIDKNAPQASKLEKLVKKSKPNDNEISEIERLALVYGADCSLDREKWIPLSQLQTFMPVEIYNDTRFLRDNKTITVSDDKYLYLARILDYTTENQISPLDYEHDNIKAIILNRRKIDIIKNMQRDLLKKANEKGEIEIR